MELNKELPKIISNMTTDFSSEYERERVEEKEGVKAPEFYEAAGNRFAILLFNDLILILNST